MKNYLLVIIAFFLCSCQSWEKIGTLTVAGTRNIDSKTDYVELARYVDSRKAKELPKFVRKSMSNEPLNKEIDKAVASADGGEFLKNVQVFTKGSKVRIIGDVWGIKK